MKRKKSILWIVMIIAATILSSCRYNVGERISSQKIPEGKWTVQKELPDSVKKVISNYFDIIGPNQQIEMTKLIEWYAAGKFPVPEGILKEIPLYYRGYYSKNGSMNKEQSIVERRAETDYHKTFLRGAHTIFYLKVFDPINFRVEECVVGERSLLIIWQIVLLIALLLFTFFLLLVIFEKDIGAIVLCGAITLILFYIQWVYISYVSSVIISLLCLWMAYDHFLDYIQIKRDEKKRQTMK